MKRNFLGFLAVIILILVLPAIPALAADNPETFNHDLDYSGNVLKADQYKLNSNEGGDYWIDLNSERLYAKNPDLIRYISYDAGRKWKAIGIPQDGLDLTKIFNKQSTIYLTTQLDPKTKQPQKASEDGSVAAAPVYTFKTINARPKIEKIAVNYEVGADNTGATNGRWVLTLKNTSSALTNYQIAPTLDKKTPNRVILDSAGNVTNPSSSSGSALWAEFKRTGGKVTGVKVIGLSDSNKQQKLNYLVRIAPNINSLTPASKTKRLTVAGVSKPTNFKADYKKDIIKLRENAILYNGSAKDLETNDTIQKVYNKADAKTGADISKLMESTVCMWIAPTAKKPASAVQEVTFAKRGILDEAMQPTVKNGKVTIQTKNLEVYNEEKDKWGGMPTQNEELTKTPLRVRAKATAKGGKESDTSKFAASEEGELILEWGDVSSSKEGIVAAKLVAPEYEGVFRILPETTRYTITESDTESIDLVFDIKGMYDSTKLVLKKHKVEEDDLDITAKDAKADKNEIWLQPSIKYSSTTTPSDSITLMYDSATIKDGKLTIPVEPELACVADITINYLVGESDEEYNKSMSGTVKTTLTISSVEGGVTLDELVYEYIESNPSSNLYPPRIAVGSKKAGSGTSIRRAMMEKNAGKIEIDHEGPARFSSNQKLDKYTKFTFATAKDKDNLPDDSNFTDGQVTMYHEGWLLVKATKNNGDDPIYFAYEVKDTFGPNMKSARFDSGQSNLLIVSVDEDFGEETKTSGASFMLETVVNGKATNTWYGSNVVLKPYELWITFDKPINAANGADAVLTYNYGGSFVDDKGNAMQTDSLLVSSSSSNTLTSVTFANGTRGGSVTVPLVRPITDLTQNYTSSVAYIALGGNSTGAVTLTGLPQGKQVEYLSTSRGMITSPQTTSKFNNGDVISGLSEFDYIYFKVDSNWYAFQVVKNSASPTTDTTPPEVTSGKLTKSGSSYKVELAVNDTMIKYGFGPRADQFEIYDVDGVLVNISISSVEVTGKTITLMLAGADLEKIVPETKLKVNYRLSYGGVSDKNGNKMESFFMDKALSLSGVTSPSPSPSPSTSG